MKSLKILLIGQPNVGKSSLLNALVGPKVVVSNYPGTTVEVTQAEKVFDDVKVKFVDTPGIYSISDRSEEEKVTEKHPDMTIKSTIIPITDKQQVVAFSVVNNDYTEMIDFSMFSKA